MFRDYACVINCHRPFRCGDRRASIRIDRSSFSSSEAYPQQLRLASRQVTRSSHKLSQEQNTNRFEVTEMIVGLVPLGKDVRDTASGFGTLSVAVHTVRKRTFVGIQLGEGVVASTHVAELAAFGNTSRPWSGGMDEGRLNGSVDTLLPTLPRALRPHIPLTRHQFFDLCIPILIQSSKWHLASGRYSVVTFPARTSTVANWELFRNGHLNVRFDRGVRQQFLYPRSSLNKAKPTRFLLLRGLLASLAVRDDSTEEAGRH
jgi:hypothetical protein